MLCVLEPMVDTQFKVIKHKNSIYWFKDAVTEGLGTVMSHKLAKNESVLWSQEKQAQTPLPLAVQWRVTKKEREEEREKLVHSWKWSHVSTES